MSAFARGGILSDDTVLLESIVPLDQGDIGVEENVRCKPIFLDETLPICFDLGGVGMRARERWHWVRGQAIPGR